MAAGPALPCTEHTQPCHDAALLMHATIFNPLPTRLQLTVVFEYQASILPIAKAPLAVRHAILLLCSDQC